MCCRATLPRSLLEHCAAYNRRDCFRAMARTKVNHFVRSMQTRGPCSVWDSPACPITPANLTCQVLDNAAHEIVPFACPQTEDFGQATTSNAEQSKAVVCEAY